MHMSAFEFFWHPAKHESLSFVGVSDGSIDATMQ